MLFMTAMIASVFLAWLSRRYFEPLGQKLFMRGATYAPHQIQKK